MSFGPLDHVPCQHPSTSSLDHIYQNATHLLNIRFDLVQEQLGKVDAGLGGHNMREFLRYPSNKTDTDKTSSY